MHMKDRTILVGLDEEQKAADAVHAAALMARHFGAELEIVHAVEVPPALRMLDRDDLIVVHRNAIDRASDVLRAQLGTIEKDRHLNPGELTEHLVVLPGPADEVLAERARGRDAGIVVLGPHARRSLLDFGRTARGMLHSPPCAIWMQPGPWKTIDQVVAPIDLSEESVKALDFARRVAADLDVPLKVVHCYVGPTAGYYLSDPIDLGWWGVSSLDLRESTLRKFESVVEGVEWGDVQPQSVFCEGRPVEKILELQGKSGLVVLGTHGHGRLPGALLGSVTYAVMKGAGGPVLAVPTDAIGS